MYMDTGLRCEGSELESLSQKIMVHYFVSLNCPFSENDL